MECLRADIAGAGAMLRAATFLPDHAHFSVRAPAKATPEGLARRLLRAGWEWMTEHCRGALKLEDTWNVWEPSAYTGTTGDVTTDHVRNYVREL